MVYAREMKYMWFEPWIVHVRMDMSYDSLKRPIDDFVTLFGGGIASTIRADG